MSRTFLNRLIVFTFFVSVFPHTLTILCAQEINNDSELLISGSPSTFQHFLSFENYSEVQAPDGFFFSSSSSKSLRSNFLDIVFTQLDSWDKPMQYMMRSDNWGYSNLKIDPYLLEGKLIAEGEIAYSPTDDYDPTLGFRQYKNQMSRFYAGGTWSKFEYGVKYLYVNDEFDEEPVTDLASDKEGVEIWLNRRFGLFKVNTFYRDQWNNADFLVNRDRRKIKEGGIAFDIAIPNWPLLSLSYSRGSSSTIKSVDGSDSKLESIQTFGAYVSYKFNPKWKISLSSYYVMNEEMNKSDVTGSYLSSKVKSEFNVTKSVAIIPSIGFSRSEYKYRGGGGGSNTPTGSLLFSYRHPSENVEFKSYAEYAPEMQIDSFTSKGESEFMGFTKLFLNLSKTKFGVHKLSIEFGYSSQSQSTVYEGLSAVLAYRFAPFDK